MTPAAWLRLLLHPLAGQHPKNQQIFGDPVGWHVISINYLFFLFLAVSFILLGGSLFQ
jgi:hypothetical protein